MKITKDTLKQLIKEELAASTLAEGRGAPSWKAAVKARPEKDAERAEEEARDFDRERFEQGAQVSDAALRSLAAPIKLDAPDLDPGSARQPTVPRVPTVTADEVRVKINALYKAGKISRPVMIKARRALYAGDEYDPTSGIEAALTILGQGGQRMRQPGRQEPGRATNESKQRFTKNALKQLIKEELENVLSEEPSPEKAKSNPTYNLAVRKITSRVKDALKFSDVVFAGVAAGGTYNGEAMGQEDFVVKFELKDGSPIT